jgi:hypothetical protein
MQSQVFKAPTILLLGSGFYSGQRTLLEVGARKRGQKPCRIGSRMYALFLEGQGSAFIPDIYNAHLLKYIYSTMCNIQGVHNVLLPI